MKYLFKKYRALALSITAIVLISATTQIRMEQVYGLLTALGLKTEAVDDITALQAYAGAATSIKVKDSLRGGLFHYYAYGLTVDNFVAFPATGKGSGYWKRDVPGNRYAMTWAGVSPGCAPRDNLNNLQNAINYTPEGCTLYGNISQVIQIDSSLYIRKKLMMEQFSLKAVVNPLIVVNPLGYKQDMLVIQADSVTISHFTLDGSSGTAGVPLVGSNSDTLRFNGIYDSLHNYLTVTDGMGKYIRKNFIEINTASYCRVSNVNADSVYRDAVSITQSNFITVENLTATNSLYRGGGEFSDSSNHVIFRNWVVRHCVYAFDIDSHSPTNSNKDLLADGIISDSNNALVSITGSVTKSPEEDIKIMNCTASNGLGSAGAGGGDIDLQNINHLILSNIIIYQPHYTGSRIRLAKINNATASKIKFSGLQSGTLFNIRETRWTRGYKLSDITCDSLSTPNNAITVSNVYDFQLCNSTIIGGAGMSGNIVELDNVGSIRVYNNSLKSSSGYSIYYNPTTTVAMEDANFYNNNLDSSLGLHLHGTKFSTYMAVNNTGIFSKQNATQGTSTLNFQGLSNGLSSDSLLTILNGVVRKVASPGGITDSYTIQASSANLNPADGANVYIGPNAAAAGGTANINRLYIPQGGIIKKVWVTYNNSGTVGSSETSTINVRLNNSGNTVISSAVTNDAGFTVVSNTGLNIAVSAGDYIEALWQCPTWATNPTAVRISVIYYIESN